MLYYINPIVNRTEYSAEIPEQAICHRHKILNFDFVFLDLFPNCIVISATEKNSIF